MAYTNQLETLLNELLVLNFPVRLAKSTRETIAKVAPWFLLFGGIFLLAFAWGGRQTFLPHVVLSVGVGVLYLISFPKLLRRQKSGWDLVFYASLLDCLLSLIDTLRQPYFIASFVGLVLGQFAGFYLLFQVRSEYLHHDKDDIDILKL